MGNRHPGRSGGHQRKPSQMILDLLQRRYCWRSPKHREIVWHAVTFSLFCLVRTLIRYFASSIESGQESRSYGEASSVLPRAIASKFRAMSTGYAQEYTPPYRRFVSPSASTRLPERRLPLRKVTRGTWRMQFAGRMSLLPTNVRWGRFRCDCPGPPRSRSISAAARMNEDGERILFAVSSASDRFPSMIGAIHR